MCCIIAMSLMYANHRIQENIKRKQRRLKDPVLFYVDMMMRDERPVEDIVSNGIKLFGLEETTKAEKVLVKVMKGEKVRQMYSGSEENYRCAEAAHSLRRIVWLLTTIRRYSYRERYRHIQFNACSTDVCHFVESNIRPARKSVAHEKLPLNEAIQT